MKTLPAVWEAVPFRPCPPATRAPVSAPQWRGWCHCVFQTCGQRASHRDPEALGSRGAGLLMRISLVATDVGRPSTAYLLPWVAPRSVNTSSCLLPSLYLDYLLFPAELWKLFVHSRYSPLVGCAVCGYFLLVSGLCVGFLFLS